MIMAGVHVDNEETTDSDITLNWEDTHRITKSKYLFVLLHDTVKIFLRQQYCPPGAYNLKQSTLIVDPVIKALYQMQTLYL